MSDSGNSTCGSECESGCGSAIEPMTIPFTIQVTSDEPFAFDEADFGMRVDSLTLLKGNDCVIYQEDPQYGKICLGRLVHPYCVNLSVNMDDFVQEVKIICVADASCTVAVTGVLQEPDGDEEMLSDGDSSVDGEAKESSLKIEEVPNLEDESSNIDKPAKTVVQIEKEDTERAAEKIDSENSSAESSESEAEVMEETATQEEEAVSPKKSPAEKKKDVAVQKRPAKKEPVSPKKSPAATKTSGEVSHTDKETTAESKSEAESTKAGSPKGNESTEIKTGVRRQLGKGLAYEILEVGKGSMAVSGKQANVKYVLTLAKTGQKMDAGVLKFRLGSGEVVQGFDKGVKGMCVLERRRIFVPSELGYGKKKTGKIPPNSDLIFEVTLMGVKN